MRWISWFGGVGMLALCVIVARAAPEAHPTHKDRWIERRGGFSVEYSAGDEAYLDATFAALAQWRSDRPKLVAEVEKRRRTPVPFSPGDLRQHRDAILRQVAAETGLPGPTAIQGRTYDAMVGHYEMLGYARAMLGETFLRFSEVTTVSLWRRAELARRLREGEQIPNFKYEPANDGIDFSFNFDFDGSKEAEAKKEIQNQSLEHSFNYQAGKDGIVDFSASFHLRRGARLGAPLEPAERNEKLEASRVKLMEAVGSAPIPSYPMVIAPKDETLSPSEFCTQSMERASGMLRYVLELAGYRELHLAHVVLHEAVEVGLVENVIGSADRRWLCDGTANYVAWKIIRDRSDVATADQAYALRAQLAQYADVQSRINLRHWPAVENQTEADKNSGLIRAHYPFATRALFDLARQNGEPAVAKLWREIARTPRRKVTMATVEKAYAKVTGRKLSELLAAAEKAPVPQAPSAPKPAAESSLSK